MKNSNDLAEIERLVKEDGDIAIEEMTDREKKLWARVLRKDKQMLEAIIKDASENLEDINKDLEQLEGNKK